MKTIILKNGPCDGERVLKVSEYARIHWRSPGLRHERYRHSDQFDTATGSPIFVYTPRRPQA